MKALLKGKIIIIAIIITISILYLSLMKMPKMDSGFGNSDKIYHSFAYFTLTISWLFSFYKKPSLKYIILIACIIFGIIIEVLQHTITNYRTGDYLDIIANSIGVLFGLLIFNQVSKKNLVK